MRKKEGMTWGGRVYKRVVRHFAIKSNKIEHPDYDEGFFHAIECICGISIHEDATNSYLWSTENVTCKKCILKGKLEPEVKSIEI